MSRQDPTYLYQYKNSSNYYFRINLIFFQKFGYYQQNGHFVASLKTSNYQDARWLALYVKRKIEKEFDMHTNRTQAQTFAEASEGRFKVKNKVGVTTIDDIENKMSLQKTLREIYKRLLKVGQLMLDAGLDEQEMVILSRDEIDLAFSKPRKVPIDPSAPNSEVAESWLPISLDKNHVLMFSQVMFELQKRTGLYEYSTNLTSTPPIKDFSDFILALAQQSAVRDHVRHIQEEENTGFSLTHQFGLFIEQQRRKVNPKTIEGYYKKFDLFFNVIDKGLDVRLFDKQHMQKLKSFLLNSYANANKGSNAKKMSPKTINTYLSNYRTFFAWLVKHVNGVDMNPFDGVSISEKSGKQTKRRSFSTLEVQMQLNYEFAHGSEARLFRNDAMWFVRLAIYTGMRLNEIAALSFKNVVKIQNIWCFDLTGLDVKNESSNRIVPIAQYLLDCGILEYMESLKNKESHFYFLR
jgi:site-specific recombinase XerC